MGDIGALVIKIGADASGLEKAFHDLGGSAKQFQRGLDSISKTMQTAFLAGVTAAAAMTIQAGKTAEETEQLAQKTGIAAVALEGMSVGMSRYGLSSQSMTMAIKGLSTAMIGVRQGSAASIKLFDDMGLSLAVLQKGTGATLRAIADRFKDIPDGAMKAKLAVDLFGRAGLDWIPMLNKGSAAMDQAMKKSVEFGLVLTDTARNQLTTFDDAMDDMQSALKGFAMQVGIAFAPSMTILVNKFTDVIVFTKNVFNQLSDAASVLGIRIGAMVAAVQLLGQQLLSTSVFSKEAWQQTMAQVSAIDKWAAAEIQGVAVAREAEKGLEALALKQMEAAVAAEKHGTHQKKLGEQIVATTRIQIKQRDELSKQIFADIFAAEEAASSANYALGPEPGSDTGRQRMLKENIMMAEAEFSLQKAFYAQAPGMIGAATAAREKGLAVIEAQSELEMQAITDSLEAEQIKDRKILALDAETQAKRMALAQQFPSFWGRQLNDLVASNQFSLSQITSAWTSGLANAIVNGGDFAKAAWQSTQMALVQGGLNLAVQWGAQQGMMVASSGVAASAVTAIWAGASAAIGGFFAATTSAFTAMVASMTAIVTAVGTFIMGVLSAIAAALTATVFGIPWAGAILAGIALIAAALAATGNLGFKEGGIGDFGSGTPATLHGPEAIIPLNSRGAAFMRDVFGSGEGSQRPIHTHVYLDKREIARAVTDEMPGAWREAGFAT